MIKRHAVIDEKSPFILYAVEVHSPYSKRVIQKRYNHFSILYAQVSLTHMINSVIVEFAKKNNKKASAKAPTDHLRKQKPD